MTNYRSPALIFPPPSHILYIMFIIPSSLKRLGSFPTFWPIIILATLALTSASFPNAFTKPFYESTAIIPKNAISKNNGENITKSDLTPVGVLIPASFKSVFLSFITEEQPPQTRDGSLIGYSSPIGVIKQISIKKYNAQKGDTIASIAAKFNLSLETVKLANQNLKEPIKKGQPVTILPVSGLLYNVKLGDSAEVIASLYNTKKALLEAYNPNLYNILENGNGLIILPYAAN